MKFNRTKNTTRNILFGWIYNVYQLFLGFINRTLLIHFLGIEYLGLSSLFASILSVLNLAELGAGAALAYSMYKPIAENDTERICNLLNLYKKYYRIIGTVILIAGIAVAPFLPYLVKEELPGGLNLYILYGMNLLTTVLTYWLFAYKSCLIMVHQRSDVNTKITMLMQTVTYVALFGVLVVYKNYYLYLGIQIVSQIVHNIITARTADKMFPDYRPRGSLPKEEVRIINGRVKDLFTSKIGGTIVDSADTLVITYFLGLTPLAIYNNYFFLMTSVKKYVSVGMTSMLASLGNSMVVESKEKNYRDFNKFTFVIAWISGFCTCCFLCLFQPFMQLWVGVDKMLSYGVVVCISIYFFVMEINQLLNLYKEASGYWHQDRFRPLVTALSNLTMNVITVRFWGLYGVVLSTVLSAVFIGMPWLLHNIFSTMFDRKDLAGYLRKLVGYVFHITVSCAICVGLSNLLHISNLFVTLAARLMICIIVPNIYYLICFHHKQEFKDAVALLNHITKGKICILEKLG